MSKEISNNNPKLKDFPPKLRQLAHFIEENYQFKSIKDACELAGLNYDSINVMITKHRKKGNDFGELIYSMLDKRNRQRLVFVDDAMFEKASTGDTQAAKLFYQRTGALDTGSGGDRTPININVLTVASPISQDQPIDIQQEREKVEKEKDLKD